MLHRDTTVSYGPVTHAAHEVMADALPQPPPATAYLLGLDLGQAQDYTALVIAEQHGRSPQTDYDLRYLERVPLGTAYPTIIQ